MLPFDHLLMSFALPFGQARPAFSVPLVVLSELPEDVVVGLAAGEFVEVVTAPPVFDDGVDEVVALGADQLEVVVAVESPELLS